MAELTDVTAVTLATDRRGRERREEPVTMTLDEYEEMRARRLLGLEPKEEQETVEVTPGASYALSPDVTGFHQPECLRLRHRR